MNQRAAYEIGDAANAKVSGELAVPVMRIRGGSLETLLARSCRCCWNRRWPTPRNLVVVVAVSAIVSVSPAAAVRRGLTGRRRRHRRFRLVERDKKKRATAAPPRLPPIFDAVPSSAVCFAVNLERPRRGGRRRSSPSKKTASAAHVAVDRRSKRPFFCVATPSSTSLAA